ncbi:TolC family protein [Xanthomarina gelatinilytica]|uniref:TolC family protein n=2 Tax=Xanthomarina gelatinilytica TaxID=1137281 RepID=UPI003AA98D2B
MRYKFLIIFLLVTSISWSQKVLTIEECYQLAKDNYPLAKQTEMLHMQQDYEVASIQAERLPQLGLDAQATYQSDVIEVPIPDSSVESPNNEQYRASIKINQLIYGSGLINAKTNLIKSQFDVDRKQVEVNIYQLKGQINQLYYSILLMQENHELLLLQKAQLKTKLDEVKSGVEHGVLLPTSDKAIEVELLKIDQNIESTIKDKASLIHSLSLLIGFEIAIDTAFETPLVSMTLTPDLKRPELELFHLKKAAIDASSLLLSKENTPKLFGFADGGFGNPGLNPLDNSFQGFYMVGLGLKWNVFDWNSNKKERKALQISSDIIDNETEVFELNTNIELSQHESDINKLGKLIEADNEIIKLRKEVLKATESQLRNGVITTSVYITELTNLYEEENRLITHSIQRELAKSNYNIIKGD